jgi:hypothetical protein
LTTLLQILNSGAAEFFSSLRAASLGIGTAATSNAHIAVAASATAKSSLILSAGPAPSVLADGMIWYDGSNFKCREAGVTRTL